MKKRITLVFLLLMGYFNNSFIAKGQSSGSGDPDVNLVVSSQQLVTGTNLLLKADAHDSDGSITKAEFFRNGWKLGVDHTFPYTYEVPDVKTGSYEYSVKVT